MQIVNFGILLGAVSFFSVQATWRNVKDIPADTRSAETVCSQNVKRCKPGHEVSKCWMSEGVSGYVCKECSRWTFQPYENTIGDRCRLRKSCNNPYMLYEDIGNTTRDACCKCEAGYHFYNEEKRVCVSDFWNDSP